MQEMFACLYHPATVLVGQPCASASERHQRLERFVWSFSPRYERYGDALFLLDVGGLKALFGTPRDLGGEMRRQAADLDLHVHVAIAATRVTALLMAYARAGLTIVPAGSEAATLAPLPLRLLERLDLADIPEVDDVRERRGTFGVQPRVGRQTPRRAGRNYRIAPPPLQPSDGARLVPETATRNRSRCATRKALAILAQWGLKTLGDLEAIAPAALAERLGSTGLTLQRCARGQDIRPLVPDRPEERFEESLALEWPIETLEPLSFVLGQMLEPLCRRLEYHDAGVAVLSVRLYLITREAYVRTLQLPTSLRDPRVLRTLVLLDLESHPPSAGIDRITIAAEPTPGQIVRLSLFERAHPSPEQLSTLLARLRALLGADGCGAATLIDTHRPGAFTMDDFVASVAASQKGVGVRVGCPRPPALVPVLRRFRSPIPIRVTLDQERPSRMVTDRSGLASGRITRCAGPWRSSGQWWHPIPDASRAGRPSCRWNRDEWEVALSDRVYRIFRDHHRAQWFLDAEVD